MARIVRWDPFREMVPLRDVMGRMVEQGIRPPVPFGLWAEGVMAVERRSHNGTASNHGPTH